ncbi:unnamed protein product [Symbiodinium sp. KB8]|nr:unnamed protein product [Symbiodinium sp. KB8]
MPGRLRLGELNLDRVGARGVAGCPVLLHPHHAEPGDGPCFLAVRLKVKVQHAYCRETPGAPYP